mgnify:FL=1
MRKEDLSWEPLNKHLHQKSFSNNIILILQQNHSSLSFLHICLWVQLFVWSGKVKALSPPEEKCSVRPILYTLPLEQSEETSVLMLEEISSMDLTPLNQLKNKLPFGSNQKKSTNGNLTLTIGSTNDLSIKTLCISYFFSFSFI